MNKIELEVKVLDINKEEFIDIMNSIDFKEEPLVLKKEVM